MMNTYRKVVDYALILLFSQNLKFNTPYTNGYTEGLNRTLICSTNVIQYAVMCLKI